MRPHPYGSPRCRPDKEWGDGPRRLRPVGPNGHCHGSVAELLEAAQAFLAGVNRDPVALVGRLWPKFAFDPEFEEKLRVSA